MSTSLFYFALCAANVIILKEVNSQVTEPYMDEPFHVPQAQAYCQGKWTTWDPKITTPPGLYVLSVLLSKVFLFKCTLPVLRLSSLLPLLSLPLILTRLLSYQRRERPPRAIFSVRTDALALSLFPIAWFFGFLYYTDVPSLAAVLATVVAALEGRHVAAAVLGLLSCLFRQTNIIWVFYAFAYSQLRALAFRRATPTLGHRQLYDPPALSAAPNDILRSILSILSVVPQLFPQALPYTLDFILFAGFVYWNGGIVLGDKSNHIPSIHIPQLYYFIGFSTAFGWPVLVGGPGGLRRLLKGIWNRMFGNGWRIITSILLSVAIAISIHFFTIHHPFLLSDNRHYTFYIWRRVFRFHVVVPYLFAPLYLACAWAWFLRVGTNQSFLQTILLPLCTAPTLLLTPLLEPRYFLIPYILLRSQITDMRESMVWAEAIWYGLINWATMYVFLYEERPGVGRFMW